MNWLYLIIAVVALILFGMICAAFRPIWTAVKFLARVILLIISAPFILIAKLIKKRK